jgi:hypothetical protein
MFQLSLCSKRHEKRRYIHVQSKIRFHNHSIREPEGGIRVIPWSRYDRCWCVALTIRGSLGSVHCLLCYLSQCTAFRELHIYSPVTYIYCAERTQLSRTHPAVLTEDGRKSSFRNLFYSEHVTTIEVHKQTLALCNWWFWWRANIWNCKTRTHPHFTL